MARGARPRRLRPRLAPARAWPGPFPRRGDGRGGAAAILPGVTHLSALHSEAGADGIPEWVHLVPSGTFSGQDGRGPYRLSEPAAVIAASMAAGKLPIDENHATDLAAPRGEPAPARGWIVEMQGRADGLWGRVEWTDSGRALMADQSYRGVSPVFTHDKQGRVTRVLRAALTNTPNLGALATLHTQQDAQMDFPRMRTLLGLPADADEAAIFAAIEARNAAQEQATALQAQLTALQAAAIKPDVVVALQAQVATLQAAQARATAVAAIDAAIAAGKPIAPLRDHYIARHMADAASVAAELDKLPSLHAGGMDKLLSAQAGDDSGLSAEQMSVARKMGVDPKKLAQQMKGNC